MRTGLPVRSGVRTELSAERHLPGRECGITASPALRVIGRSHRAGDATHNNGRPRLRRRSTARLEQSAGRDPSQSISGCLQTFIENSLLYSVFLLTLFLITFSTCAVDTVKCPWSSFFFIYDTLIFYITLHYNSLSAICCGFVVQHVSTVKRFWLTWRVARPVGGINILGCSRCFLSCFLTKF